MIGSVLSLSGAACAGRAPGSAAPSLAAPATASAAATGSCDSLALRTSGVVRNRLLMLELASPDSGQRLPQPEADSLLARTAAALRLPSPLALPIYSSPGRLPEDSLGRGDSTWVHLSLDATVQVSLAADAPAAPTLLTRTYDAALDSALLQSAARAVELGRSTPASALRGPPAAHNTTRVLHLSLKLFTPFDSSIRARAQRRMARGELIERPLGEVRVRHYPHAKVPEVPRSNAQPRYPRDLQEAGVEGEVLLQFVIGPDGRLLLPTVRVLRASHPAFTAAVFAAAPRFQYIPGRVAGCPVPMRAQQAFMFQVED